LANISNKLCTFTLFIIFFSITQNKLIPFLLYTLICEPSYVPQVQGRVVVYGFPNGQ
jgi:hypothetical protein